MKPISVHVPEEPYEELKSLASLEGRPVAELIREAMAEYLVRHKGEAHSLIDIAPHKSGALRKPWTRSELLDEMRTR